MLYKLGTLRKIDTPPKLSQITLEQASICNDLVLSLSQDEDQRTPYVNYLKNETIPTTVENTKIFRKKSQFFTLIGNYLYRRGFSRPLLKYLGDDDAALAMSEAHKGICGTHIGGRSLTAKLLRARYYWPSLKRDCMNKVQRCDNYQKCALVIHNPAEMLHTSEIGWPFHRWGLTFLVLFQYHKAR